MGLEGQDADTTENDVCKVRQANGKGDPEQDLHSVGTEVGGGGVVIQERTLSTKTSKVIAEHTDLVIMTDALLLISIRFTAWA